jgi:hypothetical protein
MNRFDSVSIRILLSRILVELKSTQCRFDSIRFRVFSISTRNQSELQLRYVMIMFCLLILNFAIINANICELEICIYDISQCSFIKHRTSLHLINYLYNIIFVFRQNFHLYKFIFSSFNAIIVFSCFFNKSEVRER